MKRIAPIFQMAALAAFGLCRAVSHAADMDADILDSARIESGAISTPCDPADEMRIESDVSAADIISGVAVFSNGIAFLAPSGDVSMGGFTNDASSAAPPDAPQWWRDYGVIDADSAPNDFAAATQGQVKWIASRAALMLEDLASDGAGAGAAVNGFVASFSDGANMLPVTLGQLKNAAKPFWERMFSLGAAWGYPWSGGLPSDFAPANIGQVKRIFSFDLQMPPYRDLDGDYMPDWWEVKYGLDPHGSFDADTDADGDGLANRLEYFLGTDPRESDTDGDGLPDGWEFGVIASGASSPWHPHPAGYDDPDFDADGDGLGWLAEYMSGTDPLCTDTDGDGAPDGMTYAGWRAHPLFGGAPGSTNAPNARLSAVFDPADFAAAAALDSPSPDHPPLVSSFEIGGLILPAVAASNAWDLHIPLLGGVSGMVRHMSGPAPVFCFERLGVGGPAAGALFASGPGSSFFKGFNGGGAGAPPLGLRSAPPLPGREVEIGFARISIAEEDCGCARGEDGKGGVEIRAEVGSGAAVRVAWFSPDGSFSPGEGLSAVFTPSLHLPPGGHYAVTASLHPAEPGAALLEGSTNAAVYLHDCQYHAAPECPRCRLRHLGFCGEDGPLFIRVNSDDDGRDLSEDRRRAPSPDEDDFMPYHPLPPDISACCCWRLWRDEGGCDGVKKAAAMAMKRMTARRRALTPRSPRNPQACVSAVPRAMSSASASASIPANGSRLKQARRRQRLMVLSFLTIFLIRSENWPRIKPF